MRIHRWLGIGAGVFIFIVCLTGFLMVLSSLIPFDCHWAFPMHRWLMDVPPEKGVMTLGKFLVGFATICMVLILITGFCLWLPAGRKHFGKSLSVKTGKGWIPFLLTSHMATGMWSLLFLLVMAITGLTWSFGWYSEGFYALLGSDSTDETMRHIVMGLHTGGIGSTATRIIWLLAAFFGTLLPVTGYWIWLKKVMGKGK